MSLNRAPSSDDDNPNQLEGFRQVQVVKNSLEIENQNLKEQLADALNQQSEERRRRRRRTQMPEIEDEGLHKEVVDIASKFTYMTLLWLEQPDITFDLEPDDEYDDPHDRFASVDGWLQGQRRDLLEVIPRKFHEHISNKRFINTFIHAMVQQRSNASTRVRSHCGAAIFRCTNEEYADRGNRFKELNGWTIQNNNPESGYYETFAPILFKDYKGENDKWKIFRNPLLIRTYAALFLGPSSVKNTKGDQLFIRDPSHINTESLWGIRRLTPGAIAMTATLTRFSASGDLALKPTGKTTEIEYQEDYRTYLEYLSEGLRLNKPSVVDIFRHWNEVLYSNLPDLPRQVTSKPSMHNRRAVLDDLYNEEEPQDEAEEDSNEIDGLMPDDDNDGTSTGADHAVVITDYTQSSLRPANDAAEHGPSQSSPLSDSPHPPLRSRHINQSSSIPQTMSKKRRVVESDLSDAQGEKENAPATKRRHETNKQMDTVAKPRRVTRNSQRP